MTRNEWVSAFVTYMLNLSGISKEDAYQEAEAAAAYEVGQYGDDPDTWQGPEAAANEAMDEWHASAFQTDAPEDIDQDNGEPEEVPGADLDDLASLPRGNLPDSLRGGPDDPDAAP